MIKKNKKERLEFETKVVERHRRLEEKRDEKEQKQMYDEMQNSFVSDFESGELVH
jgi:hypothetical protein